MITIDAALAAYAGNLRPLPTQSLKITQALGRVLAAPLPSSTDLPRFDQSAMDGYALRAADTAAASAASPVRLRLTAHLAAGAHDCLPALPAGTCARILTGAPLPPDADCVIPQERVSREGDALVFTAPYPARRNVRWRGEELACGTLVAQAGQRITPGLLPALINAGIERLSVVRPPRIALLVTGDEVRPVGSNLRFGEIPDSNGPLLRAVLERWGYATTPAVHVGDEPHAVRRALEKALGEADLILSAGGASVGDHDHLPATAEQLGVRRVFWGVAQKPGKPLFFGVTGERAMFALPGNPGAVLICLCLHVRRALDCLEGAQQPAPLWHPGRLAAAVERDPQRERLLRMRLEYDADGRALLHPLPNQDSHMLSNLASA
ncbi:MAG: molybdopterin molybdotransferase MoeA, partial [Nevskia sp.]|nr:molybdopterin molybdotransferase MoeA [Nevskia sp.]